MLAPSPLRPADPGISTESALGPRRLPLYDLLHSVLWFPPLLQRFTVEADSKEIKMSKSTKMTVAAASRIYSATARSGSGAVPAGSFAARAMGAAMRAPAVGSAKATTTGKVNGRK